MKNYLFTVILFLTSQALFAQNNGLQYWRSNDKNGINKFEPTKDDTTSFKSLKVRVGGAFTQQFQNLSHSNTAAPKIDNNGKNLNQLIEIGPGFNLASANLNLDIQLADGIRMNLIAYLSSRHHPETWVKGGYLQFDKLPFLKSQFIDRMMNFFTVRVGHYEINYGDSHFHRSDNGNTIYNPFIEGYILHAFTTEIGGELFFQSKGWIGMAAVTNGEIQGGVTNPKKRNYAFIGKIGYDKQLTDNFRFRLTSSVYTTPGSVNNTLYGGDRAGSRYYLVMENVLATTSVNAFSGRFNPGFSKMVTAVVINPFIKFKGLEFFGNFEQASGKSYTENSSRTWQQIGIDMVYRFGKGEQFYIAARYNKARGELQTTTKTVAIERGQAGFGWFITKNILAKFEVVKQVYQKFEITDIRNGGQFNGFMIEACVAF